MENDFEKVALIEKKYPNIWKWRDTHRLVSIYTQATMDEKIKNAIEQYEEMGYEVLDLSVNKRKNDSEKVENVSVYVH